MTGHECPFCAFIHGDAPHPKRYKSLDGGQVVMFEPLNPRVPGHTLFVPVDHARDASAHPAAAGRAFSAAARYAAEQGGDFNLITSAGRSATQTVFHTHIHYIPRTHEDRLKLPWT